MTYGPLFATPAISGDLRVVSETHSYGASEFFGTNGGAQHQAIPQTCTIPNR